MKMKKKNKWKVVDTQDVLGTENACLVNATPQKSLAVQYELKINQLKEEGKLKMSRNIETKITNIKDLKKIQEDEKKQLVAVIEEAEQVVRKLRDSLDLLDRIH